MTPPLDLAAIRARADEFAALSQTVAASRPDVSPVAVGAHMMATHRRDEAARASAADEAALVAVVEAQGAECERLRREVQAPELAAIRARLAEATPGPWQTWADPHGSVVERVDLAALCDALDAARATIAAQAAEVERLRWEALHDTREAIAAYKDAHARADEVIAARALAADALRLGLEECERLREEVDRFRGITEARGRSIARMAEERDALRAEVAGLRAVVEGRGEPPTDEEIEAHHGAGGAWVVVTPRYVVSDRWPCLVRVRVADHRVATAAYGETWRWLPLDAAGRVCAWPVVEP